MTGGGQLTGSQANLVDHPGFEPRVVALAGGVGGARLADGLAQVLPPGKLTIIVNVGDDLEHFGLRICPDLDTVCYTLAGLSNLDTGWGLAEESWQAMAAVGRLGGATWFSLGDRDLGTHLERTRRLQLGEPLSQVARAFCQAWGIPHTVLPATDDWAPTLVHSSEGDLPFQEYFVQRQCTPRVTGFSFVGAEQARPAPGVLHALETADLIVFCPSNPWVSIDPILAIPEIRASLLARRQHIPLVAVSPIIAGKTVKGPAAKMFAEMGVSPSALAVASHYQGLLNGFVLDREDESQAEEIAAAGLWVLLTDTWMRDRNARRFLALDILSWIWMEDMAGFPGS